MYVKKKRSKFHKDSNLFHGKIKITKNLSGLKFLELKEKIQNIVHEFKKINCIQFEGTFWY